jgi:spermidine synthase
VLLGAPVPAAAQPAKPSVMAPDGVIEAVESEYNNVFVIKRGRYLYMNFGYRGSQYVESVYDSLDPGALTVEYTRYMTLATLYAGKLERGAFVGLGGGRTASYLVNSLPGFRLEIAELDPEVIRLAKTYFGVQEGDRLKVFPQDGRIFLNRAKGTYDLIFLDAYRGPFVPFHLLTKEYFELAKKRLSPKGVVAQNVEPSTMVLDSAIMTIGSVFRNVETFDAGGNVVIIAYDGDRVPESVLQQRAQALTATHKLRYPLSDLLKARKTITPAKGAKLLTDDFAPVEMLKTIKRHNERRK